MLYLENVDEISKIHKVTICIKVFQDKILFRFKVSRPLKNYLK